ncbi:MAG: winged helix-turn-helix transcriptional regulator [Asgard group archaeon]|nr:winged helix-turn-helix transcriptional regulator [Asgard group archaeon]
MNSPENQKKMQEELFDHIENFSEILSRIGHKKRIIILAHLLDGQKKFSFLEEKTNLKKTALTHHINLLTSSKLVNKIDRGLYEISQDGRELIQSTLRTYISSSLRTLEIARSLQKRFFFDYRLDERITSKMKQVSSNPEFIPHPITLIGAIGGVLNSQGIKITKDELAGVSGYCFLTIVKENSLWVTAPESHYLIESFLKALSKMGWKFSRYIDSGSLPSDDDFTKPLSDEDERRARKLFNLIKKEIDNDTPVILWGIPVPEWGIVRGYKDENYIVSTYRQMQEEYGNQIPYNKINASGAVVALTIEDISRRKEYKIDYKESIQRAVSIVKENKYGFNRYITGLEAYERWASLLLNEKDEGTKYFGNAYLIQYFLAGRISAVKFLRKLNINSKGKSQEESISRAIKEYQKIVEVYKELAKLFPLAYGEILDQQKCIKGAELINKLKKYEEKGVSHLEQALERWK